MKHLWKGAAALALFGAVVATLAAGCVEPEAPFFIIAAKAPECDVYTIDSNDLFSGTMDVRYRCGYGAVLLLGNQLVRRGDEAKLQIETSRITVTRFDVELLDAAENPITAGGAAVAFSVPATGFVDAARSGNFGQGLAYTDLIDPFTAQTLGRLFRDDTPGNEIIGVMARVVGHGRTLGGDDIKTRPWDFPITICDGCLCQCTDDETTDECTTFQDQPFDCSFLGGSCAVDQGCASF